MVKITGNETPEQIARDAARRAMAFVRFAAAVETAVQLARAREKDPAAAAVGVPLTDAIEIVAHVEIMAAGLLDVIADLKRLTKNENNPNKA